MISKKYEKFEKAGKPTFEEVWEDCIKPLKDREIPNSKGYNKIVDVTEKGITRITINDKENKIPIDQFRAVYKELVHNGEVVRKDLVQQKEKRCSSGVVRILGEALKAFVDLTEDPLTLRLK